MKSGGSGVVDSTTLPPRVGPEDQAVPSFTGTLKFQGNLYLASTWLRLKTERGSYSVLSQGALMAFEARDCCATNSAAFHR